MQSSAVGATREVADRRGLEVSLVDDLRPIALLLPMALGLSGCGWTDLDAVSSGAPDARASDARASDARAHSQDGPDGSNKGADGSSKGTDGSNEATDASNDEAAPDGEVSTAACTSDEATIYDWTFDSDVEGWALSVDTGVKASFAWTGSTGYPSSGAAEIKITPEQNDGGSPNGGWIQYSHAFGDLTGRTLAAWVWLESGTSPYLQVFAKTGAQYVWGDNGTVRLHPQTWACVSLPISTPYYSQPGYDPTDVVTIGFLFLGSAPFTVYVDTVSIY
jgi:hypothetical protein